jgi:glutaryl-CoA dehydrogenase
LIADVSTSLGTDFYGLEEQLTEEDRQVRDRVREFCDREVIPVMNDYWDRADFRSR